MELTQISKTDTTLDAGAFVDFSIKQTPVMFDILSNKLYTNPTMAIVRELLTNAYDAQVMNGNPDTPIFVKLPNYASEDFIIRDYGTGLSNEDMTQLYTTFFDSTKSSDNNLTGGFGLGSKTPFAYTDSFTVESFFNAEKSTYIVFKNDGRPTLTKINSEPTTESNGLKITIAVGALDYSEFISHVTTFSKYNPEVTLEGFENSSEYFAEDDITIYPYDRAFSHLCIKQGQNIFNVPDEVIIESTVLLGLKETLSNANATCVFTVPIGTLSVAPNREYFQINKQVCAQLAVELEKHNDKIFDLMLNAPSNSFLGTYADMLRVQKCISYPKISVRNKTLALEAYATLDFIVSGTTLKGTAEYVDDENISYSFTTDGTYYPLSITQDKTYFVIDRTGTVTKTVIRNLARKLALVEKCTIKLVVPYLHDLRITYGTKRYNSYESKETKDIQKFVKDYATLIRTARTKLDYPIELRTLSYLQNKVKQIKTQDTPIDKKKQIRVATCHISNTLVGYVHANGWLAPMDTLTYNTHAPAIVIVAPPKENFAKYLKEWVTDNVISSVHSDKQNTLSKYMETNYDTPINNGITIYCVGKTAFKEIKNCDDILVLDEQDYLNFIKSVKVIADLDTKRYSKYKKVEEGINFVFKNSRYKELVDRLPIIKYIKTCGNHAIKDDDEVYASKKIKSHPALRRPLLSALTSCVNANYNFTQNNPSRLSYAERNAAKEIKRICKEMVHAYYKK